MIELTIRIEQSNRVYEASDPEKLSRENKVINRLIYFFRVIATIIIVALLSITIYQDRTISSEGYTNITEARYAFSVSRNNPTAYAFLILTVLLSISIGILVWRLYRKFQRMEEEDSKHAFAKEMRTLIAILVFFSTSYLIRVLTYFYIVKLLRKNDPM